MKMSVTLKGDLTHGRNNVIKLAGLVANFHAQLDAHIGSAENTHIRSCCNAMSARVICWGRRAKTLKASSATILHTLLDLATFFGFSLKEAVMKKMEVNKKKHPVNLVQVRHAMPPDNGNEHD